MYYIYELIDPRTTIVVYIGITKNVKARYTAHMSCVDRNEYKNTWIRGLKSEKLKPEMRVIDTAIDRVEAEEKEARLIKDYIKNGIVLINIEHVTKRGRSEIDRQAVLCLNDERVRECFQRLDFEWSMIIDINKPITSINLPLILHSYSRDLKFRFPCQQDLIPLWISRKTKEIDIEVKRLKKGEMPPLSW